ncbi:MAG TPA: sugar ABC transporter substrate-binding protein [Ktedonobacteraceae bacterium]|jgi:simple sugar transport system substrate-binding protein|nr:sugar ABC transporter substrate-binding protein [Ktedonobacteraceae bacterium]HLI68564.1 sugar ABC transporter substrate-binding protein [Ktedonobacteraceae bacterium]
MDFKEYFSRLPIRRRRLLQTAITATASTSVAGALMAACGSGSTPTAGASGEGNFPNHPNWKFVFVNHVTTNPFFVPTVYGIQDACALLGCSYQWTGSENSIVSEMVQDFNAAIAAKADGIAVALIDPTAFNAPVENALKAGIPVVSYNADATGNARLAYIGQDLYNSGYQLGTRLAAEVKSGTVAGFIATPGSLNIQPRIDGATAAFKAISPDVKVTPIATGPQTTQELAAIEAYYLGHKDVSGMFAVDGGSTQGLSEVVDKYGLASKIPTGGFDLEPKTLQEIQAGNLGFTIDQQPYLQGFIPVVQLFLYKLSGGLMQPADTDTGLLFVTKDNVGPYLNTQTRFEGSSSQEKLVQ